MDMYQNMLMHHYRHSPHRGAVHHPAFAVGNHNPSCGDTITMTGLINGDTIEKLLFDGSGCVISQAAASLLCQASCGKSLADVERYSTTDILQLIGMPLGPTRLKCALLPLEALRIGLMEYRVRQAEKKNARSCQGDASTTRGCP